MKKLILSVAFCMIAAFSFAQEAFEGKSFGEGVKKGNVITTAEIEGKLGAGDSAKREMKVTGDVVVVCKKKGCFMTLQMPDGKTMFVNFKDYAFFMPMDIVGKKVVIDGFAARKTTSVDDLRHFAKDAQKSAEEIAKIKEPKKEIVFEAKGVVILD